MVKLLLVVLRFNFASVESFNTVTVKAAPTPTVPPTADASVSTCLIIELIASKSISPEASNVSPSSAFPKYAVELAPDTKTPTTCVSDNPPELPATTFIYSAPE